jgi:nicotinamidase-related amidase
MNKALIVIDLQKGIFELKQSVFNKDQLIRNIMAAIRGARKQKIPIYFTQHENATFLKKGSEAWKLIDEISLQSHEIMINKKHPSIFEQTNLLAQLEKCEVSKLYICGLITNGCVKDACIEGLERNFAITLISDGHSTFYRNAEKMIKDWNSKLAKEGVMLKTSHELFNNS